ncbi:hypothetical protein HK098_006637 [Nowakowskiella sp. JEL0407]|nr:hypothetical protein HK098_006637 [Nowakowskiella sp. JEL0407]
MMYKYVFTTKLKLKIDTKREEVCRVGEDVVGVVSEEVAKVTDEGIVVGQNLEVDGAVVGAVNNEVENGDRAGNLESLQNKVVEEVLKNVEEMSIAEGRRASEAPATNELNQPTEREKVIAELTAFVQASISSKLEEIKQNLITKLANDDAALNSSLGKSKVGKK